MKVVSAFIVGILYAVSIVAAPLKSGSDYADTNFSAIDKYVNAVKKDVGFPSGTAVAIVKDGKIVYEGYFGYSNIKEQKKVSDKTTFYLASISKPLFALSTLLLEKSGDIKEDASLAELFPKLDFPYIDKSRIQVKHLVSHTHGLANHPLEFTLAFTGLHDKSHRQKLAAATKYDSTNQLGNYQYSNVGYNLLSVWAENKLAQDWQKTVSQLIYQPASMHHTTSYISEFESRDIDIARPYHLYTDNPDEVMAFEKNDSTLQAAGGAYSTARDLARFLIAQLNEGMVDGTQVFPAEVIKKSHQKLAVSDLKYRDFVRQGYAWGWYIGPYKGQQTYHHFGGIAGSHSHASFMPEHNIGLVILNNEETVAASMTQGIADIAYSILLKQGDIQAITHSRIKTMQARWNEINADIKNSKLNHEKRNASRTMVLTQKKANYTGAFHHPLWGNLNVTLLKNNDLKFSLGEWNAVATAAKRPDELRIQFQIGSGKFAAFKIEKDQIVAIDVYGLDPTGAATFVRKI
jgi:CubicO group peptidase (beta-lactamase class C family)